MICLKETSAPEIALQQVEEILRKSNIQLDFQGNEVTMFYNNRQYYLRDLDTNGICVSFPRDTDNIRFVLRE